MRYPVKGLGPESLDRVELPSGGSIPFDRIFAIAHGKTTFDPARPQYLKKYHFLMLMRNPGLAAIKTTYDAESGSMRAAMPSGRTFDGDLNVTQDRRELEQLLDEYAGEESRGGPPRIVSAQDHRFFDTDAHYLSLINLNSVAALGNALDMDLDPVRFRGNLYLSDLPAWEEENMVGRDLVGDKIRFHVAARITRCMATSVNPDTAEVDVNVPSMLRRHFDTNCMGLYLSVVTGGSISKGETLQLAAPLDPEAGS